MQKIVIFMGPPSVGKSYLVQYIVERYDSYTVIEQTKYGFQDYCDAIQKAIDTQELVVIDGYHLTPNSRWELFNEIEIPKESKVIGVWVEGALKTMLEYNQLRDDPVDEEEIKMLSRFKVSPVQEEPFDEMIYITRDIDAAIRTTDPVIRNVVDVLKSI